MTKKSVGAVAVLYLLWANTILFATHPVASAIAQGVPVVGQRPETVEQYDDKGVANTKLRAAGCPVAPSMLVARSAGPSRCALDDLDFPHLSRHGITLPAIIKPLRGRGSEGVFYVDTLHELKARSVELLDATVAVDGRTGSKYGDVLILERYLLGKEVTLTMMPPGSYERDGRMRHEKSFWAVPVVERFNHEHGVAPYNGTVAVTHSSRLMAETEAATASVQALVEACQKGAALVEAQAPIRIDYRQDDDGTFYLFDLNMKPNMTGKGRSGRDDGIA